MYTATYFAMRSLALCCKLQEKFLRVTAPLVSIVVILLKTERSEFQNCVVARNTTEVVHKI